MYHKLKVGDRVISPIDWEMTPDLSFGTYESWGGRERVRNNSERVYYFFVDDWDDTPKVCLMERAVKHAKVLAEINVPRELVEKCVQKQGAVARFERSFAVDEDVKKWLIDHVLEGGEEEYVIPVKEKTVRENMGAPLPAVGSTKAGANGTVLPSQPAVIVDEEIGRIIRQWNFYEGHHNPGGIFTNQLADPGDGLTVVDERTGLQWQTRGIDICSIRMMNREIEKIRREGLAGYHDWRLPTLEEALSLMEPEKNFKGVHLHPCFSVDQPFIFVAAQRKPGGYWFVDFKQGSTFWSSGTIPGGFGRLCRNRT